MTPKFCPSCGAEIPLMVSESDIRREVEERDRKCDLSPLTWTRPYLWPGYRYWCNKEQQNG